MPFLVPLLAPLIFGTAVVSWGMAWAMVGMSLLSQLLQPSSSKGSQLSTGQSQEYSGTVEPRRIIYGMNLVSGMNAIPPWSHGANNEMLDQVLLLAGHRCNKISDCYLNQDFVPAAQIGAVTHSLNDGLVSTSGAFPVSYGGHIWIRKYAGDQNQVDTILNSAWPSAWDTNHIGYGCAYLAVQYHYDASVFSAGKPEVKALVEGKIVYDPRRDVSPGAFPALAANQVFSSNPALCIVDYLLDADLGVGEQASRIDWVTVVAAANVCDELVEISGNKFQARYSCNVVLDCTSNYEDNLKILAGSMQGAVLYTSGRWLLLVGKAMTPDFVIGDDDILGQMQFRTAMPYKERYNAVRGQFYDPENLYQPNEYSPARVGSDEIADGEGPVWRELQQPTCTTTFEAQRNAMIEQRKSRRKKTWTFQAGYSLYGIRPGSFGTLTVSEFGIAGQLVRCVGWKFDGKSMGVLLSVVEVNVDDWNDPSPVTYALPGTIMTPAPSTFVPGSTSVLTAEGVAGGIHLEWELPAIWHSNLVVDVYESIANNALTAIIVWSGVNTGVFLPKTTTTTRYYWTRVRNLAGGQVSWWDPVDTNNGVVATPSSATQGPPGPPGEASISGSLTLPVVLLSADVNGHVAPAAYAGKSGRFQVFKGVTNVSANCTYSLAPGGNPDGIQYTLNADGSYSIDGGLADATENTTLTLRASYAQVPG